MFKLEKLEIRGFKSFCDPTDLVFNDGVTAIVGPNGCGKSNVVDAIAWVLGEQSAKELRGGKMEDVIFNGTRDRKPVGMAEVILTLIATEDVVPTIHEVDDIEIPVPPVIELPEELAVNPGQIPAETGATVETSAETSSETGEQTPEPEQAQAAVKHPAKHAQKRAPKKKGVTSVSKGERVVISRRLYRSGDSDYLLNGRQCRLRDIQELISGTGLGGGHYAIIEQGHIDRVLSSKPYERRSLIEDAAGISIFKMKRRSAELRLESTRQNLSRLNDIVTEIERQINSLKRQAAKARRYRRLREELRELLRVIFTGDHERITTQLERLATAHAEAQQLESQLSTALFACETDHAAAVQMAREAEDNLNTWRERATTAALEADRAANKKTFQTEQVTQFSTRLTEIEREQGAISERLALLANEREQRITDLKQLDDEVHSTEEKLRGQESVYRAELERLTTSEGELEKLRQRLVGEIGRTERLRHHSQQLDDSFQRVEGQLRTLVAEGERAAQRRSAAEIDLSTLNEELAAGEQRLAEIQTQLSEITNDLRSTEHIAETQTSDLANAEKQRGALRSRLVSLQDLDAHHAYYSEAVQHLFNNSDLRLLGTLADFVEVSPQHEPVVESVLGDRLHTVLVPTLDDAVRGIEMLNAQQAGRASFISVGLHGGEEDPSVAPSVADVTDEGVSYTANGVDEAESQAGSISNGVPFLSLLQLKPEILAVIERVWPDLSSITVVENLQTAIRYSFTRSNQTYVALTGEAVRAGSLITGGSRKTQGTSVLTLKREIKELSSQIDEMSVGIENAQLALAATKQKIAELREQSRTLDSQVRTEEKNAVDRQARARELRKELERAEQHVRVVIEDTAQSERDRSELLVKVEQVKNELTAAEAQRTALEADLLNAQMTLGQAKGQLEEQSQVLSQMRAEAAARLERRRACASEIRRMEVENVELNDRLSHNRYEASEASDRVEELRFSIAEIDSRTAEYARVREETEAAVAEITSTVAGERTRVDDLNAQLKKMRSEVSAARDNRGNIEIERARLSAELDYLRESCNSELNISLDELLASKPAEISEGVQVVGSDEFDGEESTAVTDDADASLQNSKERLEYLRRKLDEIGPVNLLALEEVTEAQQRYDFLTAQRKDILDSIASTEEALNEIKRRSRQRFRDAFAAINANFSQLFVELFGGGRGEMSLLEDEDILEAGIDIVAQPPGKRLQNVLLLSGGEKAMTALALTLAIFRYRPSPFCVLDEVDAPLDEVNTGRFCDKILQMSEETQFLVITHTKRTMEAARALYGVTMEEPGISKLLSVRFE